jgi:hypothetical protein
MRRFNAPDINPPPEPWAPRGYRSLGYAIELQAHELALSRVTTPVEPPELRPDPLLSSQERPNAALPYDGPISFDLLLAGKADLRRWGATLNRERDEKHRSEIAAKHTAKRKAEYESALAALLPESRGIMATKLENREIECVTFDKEGDVVSVSAKFWRSEEGRRSVVTGKKDGDDLFVRLRPDVNSRADKGRERARKQAREIIEFFNSHVDTLPLTNDQMFLATQKLGLEIDQKDFNRAKRGISKERNSSGS